MIISKGILDHELNFNFSRSSGPGGQHVNKVNTKVELRFNILQSNVLNDHQKETIQQKLSTKINHDGELIIISQEKRSQLQNKELAIDKFYQLINKALTPRKEEVKNKYQSFIYRKTTEK